MNFAILEIKQITMVKYIIKRMPNVAGFVMGYEYLKVSKNDLNDYLIKGWEIDKKEYFFCSYVIKIWDAIDRGKKIEIILVAILGWLLSKI